MLAKYLISRSLAMRNGAALSRAYHQSGGKMATMDDLPVPQGDWQEANSRRQAKYNTILAVGIAVFVGTISVAKQSGLVYLNYSPPEL